MSEGVLNLSLIDLGNSEGDARIAYFSANASNYYSQSTLTLKVVNSNVLNSYSIPVLVNALGPSIVSGFTGMVTDTYLSWDVNGGNVGTNSSWTSDQSGIIASTNHAPDYPEEASFFTGLNSRSSHTFVNNDESYGSFGRSATELFRFTGNRLAEQQVIYSGQNASWLTYDVRTGFQTQSIFAYSVEALSLLSGLSGPNGANLVEDATYPPSVLLYNSGYAYSGNCNQISILLQNTGAGCSIQAIEDETVFESCDGPKFTAATIEEHIRRITAETINLGSPPSSNSSAITDSQVTDSSVNFDYVVYKAALLFNQPQSGDSFCFRSYPLGFDYSAEYSGRYSSAPPYDEVNLCFYYPDDYTGIDSLVSKINTSLSGSGYYIWNRNTCDSSSSSGLYEYGPLVKATKIDENTIVLDSMRVGMMGKYEYNALYVARPTPPVNDNIVKYLLPRNITLQAADIYGNWINLDSHSGIDWSNASERIVVDTFTSGLTGVPRPDNEPDEPEDKPSATGNFVPQLVYTTRISGVTKCGVNFNKNIEFYSVPSGLCSVDSNQAAEDGALDADGASAPTTGYNLCEKHYLKTGFKFNNLSGYNYYRLYFDGFESSATLNTVKNLEQFYMNSINFYGIISGNALHSGSVCLLGASYTGQIKGLTSGTISGTLTGFSDASGLLCFDHYMVTGVPNYNGDVIFQSAAGKATTAFTGLVTLCETGVDYYEESAGGYFYNTGSQCIEFSKPVSGVISGSGMLTGGPYNIIFNDVASSFVGSQIVSGQATGLASGVIPDFLFNATDLPAFTSSTGIITGAVGTGDAGHLVIHEVLYESPSSVYSLAISSTVEATNVLYYNVPEEGDAVFINDALAIFSQASGKNAPTYYQTLSGLNNIINSGSNAFGVTSVVSGSGLMLTAVALGLSGNGISCYTTGSLSKPYFQNTGTLSGITNHYSLNGSNVFSGILDLDIPAVEYIQATGSGVLTGIIKQLDFIREYSGVWNIKTGDSDFRDSGWVESSGAVYTNTGYLPYTTYSGHPSLIPIEIVYTNKPTVATVDLATLLITGYNCGTGLSIVLSGQI